MDREGFPHVYPLGKDQYPMQWPCHTPPLKRTPHVFCQTKKRTTVPLLPERTVFSSNLAPVIFSVCRARWLWSHRDNFLPVQAICLLCLVSFRLVAICRISNSEQMEIEEVAVYALLKLARVSSSGLTISLRSKSNAEEHPMGRRL